MKTIPFLFLFILFSAAAHSAAVVTFFPAQIDFHGVQLNAQVTPQTVKMSAISTTPIAFDASIDPPFSVSPVSGTVSQSSSVTFKITANTATAGQFIKSLKVVNHARQSFVLGTMSFVGITVLSPQPDLVVRSVDAFKSGVVNGKNQITVRPLIENHGATSVACTNEVLFDGVVQATFTLDPLATSTQKEILFLTDKTGSHEIKVRVDTDNKNAEGTQGEANNGNGVTIQIQ